MSNQPKRPVVFPNPYIRYPLPERGPFWSIVSAKVGPPLCLIAVLWLAALMRSGSIFFDVAKVLFFSILILTAFVAVAAFGEWVEREQIEESKYPHCQHCRYNITGLRSGDKCPECGEVIEFTPCQWR